jgi:beta-phosphoglucomutase-like phosphatase (HAD superfamily)
VVEDAAAGIEAARRAGMAPIGVGPHGVASAAPDATECAADTVQWLVGDRCRP